MRTNLLKIFSGLPSPAHSLCLLCFSQDVFSNEPSLKYTVNRRVTAAQRIIFDVDEVSTVPMKDLIKVHASTIGCPTEFIFFPLLSIALHFMGLETGVMVNEEWQEPLILWNVVLADTRARRNRQP